MLRPHKDNVMTDCHVVQCQLSNARIACDPFTPKYNNAIYLDPSNNLFGGKQTLLNNHHLNAYLCLN